jgi:hypothetical protein
MTGRSTPETERKQAVLDSRIGRYYDSTSLSCPEKITRVYKAKRSQVQRESFRSWMWKFRRDPREPTPEGMQRLEELIQSLPQLRRR